MSIEPDKIKNILVIRDDRFGEFLLNIPALRAIKETYPRAKLSLLVSPYVKELAGYIPYVDEVISYAAEGISLKKRKFDIAIMLNPSKKFNIATFLAGIPVRVGYNRKWGFLLNKKMEDKKCLGVKHEIEYNLELVGLIGAKTEDKSLGLNVKPEIINNLLNSSGIVNSDILIAVHPFTSDPIKQWRQEYFIELANKLIAEFNLKVIIIGGRGEDSRPYDNLNNRIINLVGKTTLVELAALLKRSVLLISADSGPVHLACCVGTPVIAIFRDDIPGKTAVRWGPWGSNNTVIQAHDLKNIKPNEVLDKIRIQLNEKVSLN